MFNFNTYLDIPIYLFTIEGNIGAGKTTLLSQIENNKNKCIKNYFYYYIDEPVNIWSKEYVEDNNSISNPLKCQYENPEQYFFPFQVVVLQSYYDKFKNKLENIKEILGDKIKKCKGVILICDRSPFTMKKVFYDGLCKRYKNLNWMIDAYNKMYNTFFENFFTNYNIIYINTSIKQCYINKNKRCRDGEEIISMDFLQLLNNQTEKYIDECKEKNIKILDYSYFNNDNLDKIFDFINDIILK